VKPHRLRPLLAAATAVVCALALPGCSGSSLDSSPTADATIKIGLVWPQSGPYESLGKDLAAGWQLYLDTHDGKLGGQPVTVVPADEGKGAATALPAAKKLVDADRVQILVGTMAGDSAVAVSGLATTKKIPFIGTGGRPSKLDDLRYTWHTSWLSTETGKSVASHIAQTVDGPVYVLGPDYQGGWDQIAGFTDEFTRIGGKLANPGGKPTWTPWDPPTTNFLPYFNAIRDTDAKAVYCFYAGTSAVEAVKQYRQSGLTLPLYGAGFLTEGAVLDGEGAAADGVRTAMNYAANLDNAPNRAFATAYEKKTGRAPTIYAVAGWDAALILDRAIAATLTAPTAPPASASSAAVSPTAASAAVGSPAAVTTSEAINTAISRLDVIDESPRGPWRFGSQHSPNQTYYLREVRVDGRTRSNVLVQNLTTLTN
jgi:branched-chain amino acid transport system substrate-binding protein